MPKLEAVLLRYFGYSSFRPLQKEIISCVLAGQDVLAILPTGGGKSICYQLPSLVFDGTTIVISPLIALMKDQVEALARKQIRAGFINSSQPQEEQKNNLNLFASGYFKLLYVAPERLQTKKFLAACKKTEISLVAVDEAHCISQWGHEFRPEYFAINSFVSRLPRRPPVIALTATASKQTQTVIVKSLALNKPQIFRTSIVRHNLSIASFACHSYSQKLFLLAYLLLKFRGSLSLVYCSTRQAVEEMYYFFSQFDRFNALGINYYHAGLSKEQRTLVQTAFLNKSVKILFCTNAFGMGIDQPDIRLIAHFQPPASLEAYSQEIGRAGRDGKQSLAVCFYRQLDWRIHQRMISGRNPQQEVVRKQALWQMAQFFSQPQCKNQVMQKYFGEETGQKCLLCDNCNKNLGSQLLPKISQISQNVDQATWPLSSQLWSKLLGTQNQQEVLALPGIGCGWLLQN